MAPHLTHYNSWCPWRESDPRPLPYQGSALPLSHMGVQSNYPVAWSGRRGSNSRHLAWKASALPTELHPRTCLNNKNAYKLNYYLLLYLYKLVEGEGFEPSYSERTDLQSVAFNHSATPPNRTLNYVGFLGFCQTNEGLIARE